MTNPFRDQERFMRASGQTVGEPNPRQYALYRDLIKEEHQELLDAVWNNDSVEQLDALIDILVVTVGAIHSMGADAEGAWNEVMRTNMAKVDPRTGKVTRREDGKVLKPEGWEPPRLQRFIREQ
jgi:predicted HAD superfamily Cof-like phosphohydrolase